MSDQNNQTAQDTTKAADTSSVDTAAPATILADKTKEAPVAAKPEGTKAVVPEKYDLKLPKDSRLDDAYIAKLASEAKEKGLSNEQAQQILERDSQIRSSFEDSQKAAMEQRVSEWANEVKADKEIGGEAFGENTEHAKRAIEKFAPESLKKILNETGLGNHPDLVRTFVRIGKAMADDKLVTGSGNSGAIKKDASEVLYGSKN